MEIKNLSVSKSGINILKNLSVNFEEGKIHIIMGPNGSGKSTLSYTIAGHPDCDVSSGEIIFNNSPIVQKTPSSDISLDIHARAIEGIYLAPQYPPSIPGLSHAALLKESINVRLESRGEEPLDDFQFLKLLREKAKEYQFDGKNYPKHSFNEGFSGGEKKRNEILQISLLHPDFVILDEIDSGLDIEAMRRIAQFIVDYKEKNRTIIVITHYPQFADIIEADYVHIVKNGQVVKSGDKTLVSYVEKNGFGEF